MTVYLDVVFIENLILNYIILLSVNLILKKPKKYIRILCGSIIGTVYTVMTYILGSTIYSNAIFKFALSIVIVWVSFCPQTIKKMWKDLLYFYLITFVFGGITFAMIYIVRPQDIFLRYGVSMEVIVFAVLVGFILVILAFKLIKSKISREEMYCEIEMFFNNKAIKTTAIIDTGNFLKEPITGMPVIVVEHVLLYDLIPKQILNNLEEIIGGNFENVPIDIRNNYMSKLKLIPFSSLGKENGMLLGLKAEKIKVFQDNAEKELKNEQVVLGIYNKSFTKKGEYQALIGIEIFK